MKKALVFTTLSALLLSACNDNRQAQLEQQIQQQQEQISQMQTQMSGGQAQEDETVYALASSAVAETIPQQYANGNNGEPVTGTDGQQYIQDQNSGDWLLYGMLGAGLGMLAGRSMAGKYAAAQPNSAAAQRVRADYHQSQPYKGKSAGTSALRPQQKNATQQNNTAQKQQTYRQTQQAPSNYQQPARKRSRGFGFGSRRRR